MEQARWSAEQSGQQWKAIEEFEESLTPEGEIPPGFNFLWEAFSELSNARTCGFGPNPIQWSEIEAYGRVHGFTLSHWEMATIKRLDLVWLNVMAEESKKDKADG